jgi:hypothetical protein
MSDFLSIPGHEPYTVNALGQVRVERKSSKLLLSHDAKGRVTLRENGRTAKFFVGELLDLAGYYHNGSDKAAVARAEETARDALERLALAESEARDVRESLDKARKANALLLGIRSSLAKQVAEMEEAASGKAPRATSGRKPKNHDFRPGGGSELDELSFESWGDQEVRL